MSPAQPLLCRQDFEACRPPAGEDRLNELIRQAFLLHFLGQPAGIVFYWHELDLKLSVAKFQHRVPDILLAVIFGTPQTTNIDKMAAVWKRPMPFDTSMCCGDDIRLVFARQTFQECRGGS